MRNVSKRAVTFGGGGGEGPLLLGITRKVRKLALLSGSRNVRGGRGGRYFRNSTVTWNKR